MKTTMTEVWLVSLALATAAAAAPIAIGIEYCLLDNPRLIQGQAAAFGQLGVPAAKHYAEAVQWGEMQTSPGAAIDFSKLDGFVKEYQKQGFRILTICLKPHSPWASRRPGLTRKMLGLKDPTPRPEARAAFAQWIQAVVERYDADGAEDMPGLTGPITYLEIGSEFSSYEPEPVGQYLESLKLAYQSAHRASRDIRVAHAAFLLTPADLSRARTMADFEQAFAASPATDKHHDLADMRRILDHPELFDVLNYHALGEPAEIEGAMRWLRLEMEARKYRKDVIASDTMNTSYIAWGPATSCKGDKKKLGVLIPPAKESDRCRLADYFTKLVGKDPRTVAWTRAFVAADHVKRTIVAAEQGLALIHLSFTTDLPLLTTWLARAGAGISAWGGMIEESRTGQVKEKFPNYYAIQQLQAHLGNYSDLRRVPAGDPKIRLYRWEKDQQITYIGWLDPEAVILPGEPEPQQVVNLKFDHPVRVEPVITGLGQSRATSRTASPTGGVVKIPLGLIPVYISG